MQEIILKVPIKIGDTIEHDGQKLVAKAAYAHAHAGRVDEKYYAYSRNPSQWVLMWGFVLLDELKQ